jgi:hypothetical protein
MRKNNLPEMKLKNMESAGRLENDFFGNNFSDDLRLMLLLPSNCKKILIIEMQRKINSRGLFLG